MYYKNKIQTAIAMNLIEGLLLEIEGFLSENMFFPYREKSELEYTPFSLIGLVFKRIFSVWDFISVGTYFRISIPYLGKSRNTVHHEQESRNALCPKRSWRLRDQTPACDPPDTREAQSLHKNPGRENVVLCYDRFLINNGTDCEWCKFLFEWKARVTLLFVKCQVSAKCPISPALSILCSAAT